MKLLTNDELLKKYADLRESMGLVEAIPIFAKWVLEQSLPKLLEVKELSAEEKEKFCEEWKRVMSNTGTLINIIAHLDYIDWDKVRNEIIESKEMDTADDSPYAGMGVTIDYLKDKYNLTKK